MQTGCEMNKQVARGPHTLVLNACSCLLTDLYDLPPEELSQIPTVCGSLREALDSLQEDRSYLTQGNVFTEEQIDAYIELKMEDVIRLEHTTHPVEFDIYYSY